MARFARLVVPGYPYHVTQRGVRSIDIFADDEDRLAYQQFMKEEALRFGLTFHAWCLMTNTFISSLSRPPRIHWPVYQRGRS